MIMGREKRSHAIYHLCRCTSQVFLKGCRNSKEDNREVIDPVTTCQTCFQACFKVPVEPLDRTICLWMVRCDAEACSTKVVHERMPKIGLELLSLVRGDCRWTVDSYGKYGCSRQCLASYWARRIVRIYDDERARCQD